MDKTKLSTRRLLQGALIAAIYAVLTILLAPISYGPMQVRISEALTILPALTVDAVPGLFIGCVLANLLGHGVWFDVLFGSLATLIAAIFAYKWRRLPPLAAFSAVLFNTVIVGPVVYFGFVHAPGDPVSWAALLSTAGSVALGELAVCYILGLPLYYALRKLPDHLFN